MSADDLPEEAKKTLDEVELLISEIGGTTFKRIVSGISCCSRSASQ